MLRRLRAICGSFEVTGYRLQVTGYRFQVSGYRLQVAGAPSPSMVPAGVFVSENAGFLFLRGWGV
jgi:hypothetical protein